MRILEDLDICSPKFSLLRAESEIRKQKGRMLCDILLDQAVLPGVGNIIKNEALFDSGLHPAVKVCEKYWASSFPILELRVLNIEFKKMCINLSHFLDCIRTRVQNFRNLTVSQNSRCVYDIAWMKNNYMG